MNVKDLEALGFTRAEILAARWAWTGRRSLPGGTRRQGAARAAWPG
jgi:hypothetical protein